VEQDQTGKSSPGANCTNPCSEEGQLRKLFSVNRLSPLLFLLTSR